MKTPRLRWLWPMYGLHTQPSQSDSQSASHPHRPQPPPPRPSTRPASSTARAFVCVRWNERETRDPGPENYITPPLLCKVFPFQVTQLVARVPGTQCPAHQLEVVRYTRIAGRQLFCALHCAIAIEHHLLGCNDSIRAISQDSNNQS
jgi:hypothetical protein